MRRRLSVSRPTSPASPSHWAVGSCIGAVGGTAEVMEHVANDDYEMVGTFNGNPLSLSRGPGDALRDRDARGLRTAVRTSRNVDRAASSRRLIDEHGLPAHVVSVGAKGCVTFCDRAGSATTATSSSVDDRYNHAHWLMQHNGGVFLPPWGKTEQWLISVQHTQADMDRFVGELRQVRRAVSSDCSR